MLCGPVCGCVGLCYVRTGTHLTGSCHHDIEDIYMGVATHVFKTASLALSTTSTMDQHDTLTCEPPPEVTLGPNTLCTHTTHRTCNQAHFSGSYIAVTVRQNATRMQSDATSNNNMCSCTSTLQVLLGWIDLLLPAAQGFWLEASSKSTEGNGNCTCWEAGEAGNTIASCSACDPPLLLQLYQCAPAAAHCLNVQQRPPCNPPCMPVSCHAMSCHYDQLCMGSYIIIHSPQVPSLHVRPVKLPPPAPLQPPWPSPWQQPPPDKGGGV